MTSGDETGAGDQTSSCHDRAEASTVDDRLVVDWTASSSRGVDDHLDDKSFDKRAYEFTCSPSSRPNTSPWVTSILPPARAAQTSAKHKYDEAVFFSRDKGDIPFVKRTVRDAIQYNWLKHMFWT